MKKRFRYLLLIASYLILSLSFTTGFAVSSEYWDQNPIIMNPGETKEIFVTLQNMAGDTPIDAKGTIIENSEIMSLIEVDKVYTVAPGTKTQVNIKISIPSENFKEKYNAIISFKTSDVGAGDFGFGASIEREIPIIVELPTKEKTGIILYWTIVILAIALIATLIFIFLSKRRKSK